MFALWHRAVLVAVVLVAATTLSLAEGVGVVSGRVTDERGVPLEGVEVVLTSPGVLGRMNAVTGVDGRYWFPAVPGNHELTVRAEAPGRVPVEYVGHTARRNGSITIDFRLRAPGEYDILVLIEDEIPYLQTALEGALSTMPGRTDLLSVDDGGPATARALRERIADRPSAVLAFGEKAARLARRHVRDVPIVYSMVPEPHDSDLSTANICGVPLNGGYAAQVDSLLQVLPSARRVATVYNAHRMQRAMEQLREAVDAAGLELVAAHVHDGPRADLGPVLAAIEGERIDAFFLLLDPDLIDGERFDQILAFTRQEDALLVVPDPSLVTSESEIALSPGFWHLGAYTGLLVRHVVEGRVQPSQIGMTYPDSEFIALGPASPKRGTPWEMLPGAGPDRGIRLASDE